LISCSALEEKQKTNVNDIIKTQEIKKVSQTEILIAGEKIGLKLSEEIKQLAKELDHDLVQVCDSVSKVHEVNIVFGTKYDSFNTEESQEIFNAYSYALEHNLPMDHSVQSISSSLILFTVPFMQMKASGNSVELGMVEIRIPSKIIVNSIE